MRDQGKAEEEGMGKVLLSDQAVFVVHTHTLLQMHLHGKIDGHLLSESNK